MLRLTAAGGGAVSTCRWYRNWRGKRGAEGQNVHPRTRDEIVFNVMDFLDSQRRIFPIHWTLMLDEDRRRIKVNVVS
jgi:hypothetical protein